MSRPETVTPRSPSAFASVSRHFAKPVYKFCVNAAQTWFVAGYALQIRDVIHDRLQGDHQIAKAAFGYAGKHEPKAIRADDGLECPAPTHGEKAADVSTRGAFGNVIPSRKIFLHIGQPCASLEYLLRRFMRCGKHFWCDSDPYHFSDAFSLSIAPIVDCCSAGRYARRRNVLEEFGCRAVLDPARRIVVRLV